MTLPQLSRLATIEDARRNLTTGPPMANLRGRTWGGVAIDSSSAYSVTSMAVGPRDHHLLAINLADHSYVRAQRCGRVYESAGRLGEAAIIPAGEASTWDGNVPAHLTVRIPASAMVEVVADVLPTGSPRQNIANNFRIRDPFIASMATILNLEIGRAPHPAQDVLVESVVTALLLHLSRGYTCVPWRDEQSHQSAKPAALQRALSLIEDLPGIRVSLGDLAAAAGLSRFHFSRLFRQHIGVTPALYVERSRIERAKGMMRFGSLSLADIATAVGFADQSHFTKRFRHHEGCTPSKYLRDHAWQRLPHRIN